MTQYNTNELDGLFTRVMNAKEVDEKDDKYMKEYIERVFNSGNLPSEHELQQFNNLVVKQADEIAKPQIANILGLLADITTEKVNTVVQYKLPKKHKAKVVWAANGTSAEHTRVAGQDSRTAKPAKLQTGFYYEPQSLVGEDVTAFKDLVAQVAEAKVDMYFQQVLMLLDAGLSTGKIPTANQAIGTNLTLADYNKVAGTVQRYGGRPVFVADIALVDKIGQQQSTDTTFKNILTEDLKGELAHSLTITRIGRTEAISYSNPFTDATNTKTELPIDAGFMFAGGVKEKPFKIIEFGGMTQFTKFDSDLERVEMKIYQVAAVEFVFGEAIGYVKDDSVTLG